MVYCLLLSLYGLFLGKPAVLNLTHYGFYWTVCLISVPSRAARPAPLTLSLCTEWESHKPLPFHVWAGAGRQAVHTHTPSCLSRDAKHAAGCCMQWAHDKTLPIINKALCAPTWNSVHILPRVCPSRPSHKEHLTMGERLREVRQSFRGV